MSGRIQTASAGRNAIRKEKPLSKRIWINRSLFLMLLPGLLLIFIFNYGPMYGLLIAFKDYILSKGVWKSPWVGLKHFEFFFSNKDSLNVLRNTILISLYKLICGIPAPILLALAINEVGNEFYKRFVQTVFYLPHFISWVVFSGIVFAVLSPSTGIVNMTIKLLGGEPIFFMTSERWFRPILVITDIWKEAGWGTVVYLAAISGIDPQLYEAAIIDGTSRLQKIRYITFPSIFPIISIILILAMGRILNAGFDQVFNMQSDSVLGVSDILDTYVYREGLTDFKYSYTAAVGLFKSVVGLIMMLVVNFITRKINGNDSSLW